MLLPCERPDARCPGPHRHLVPFEAMSSEHEVEIARFPDASEASLLVAALAARGIPARLVSDDAGGTLPVMQALQGVSVLVPEDLAELAEESLVPPDAGSPGAIEPLHPQMGPLGRRIFALLAVLTLAVVFGLALREIVAG